MAQIVVIVTLAILLLLLRTLILSVGRKRHKPSVAQKPPGHQKEAAQTDNDIHTRVTRPLPNIAMRETERSSYQDYKAND